MSSFAITRIRLGSISSKHTYHFRTDSSPVPHDLSRYCSMFPDSDPKNELDTSLTPPSPCDPCPQKQSERGVHSEDSNPPSDNIRSSATTPHSPAAVMLNEMPSSSPATTTLPFPFTPLHELMGDKLDHYRDNDRLHHQQQQQQQQQKQQSPRPSHFDIDIDTKSLDRNPGSDSDSSSTNGRLDRKNRNGEFKPETEKDDIYWEKRRKNNEAARKSREKRRINDIMLAGRINVLEEDNSRLRRELGALKSTLCRQDVRELGNSLTKESAISGVPDSISSKCLNKNKLSRSDSFMEILGKPSHLPYSSPPPLLAVADAMALYSSGCNQGFPYLLPDATSLNQNGCLETVPLPFLTSMQHFHDLRPHHVPSFHDPTKHELIDEGKYSGNERRNSTVERTSSFHRESPQAASLRRGSVGNGSQYRNPLSSDASHHPYFNCNIIQASHVYHLQHAYDSHPLLQNAPISDIYNSLSHEEPLKLTVHRDRCLNSKSNNPLAENNNREASSKASFGEKPSAPTGSSMPSLPPKRLPKVSAQDIAYSGNIIPTAVPQVTAGLSNQPFLNSCFMKNAGKLSEKDLFQRAPVSLISADFMVPYDFGKDGIVGSRKNAFETKYLDPKYLERRRRNNEAARKCRENRKSLTQITEAKSSYLETENSKLRVEVTGLQTEMKQLRELVEKKTLQEDTKGETTFIES